MSTSTTEAVGGKLTEGLHAKKVGMTRVFAENGDSIPVTVIEALPNRITQIKTVATDGYNAVQVTAGAEKKVTRLTKPLAGHFAKAGVVPGKLLGELKIAAGIDLAGVAVGTEIKVSDIFAAGQLVDITGTSIGKGFQGTIKRWNFSSQRASHGNSISHRALGPIGQNQSPGKVFKGKKMSGHMGDETVTVQNLSVVAVDADKHLLLVKGAVPGAVGGHVVVRHACKKKQQGKKA